jgi:plasmid stabilization system protein ParE
VARVLAFHPEAQEEFVAAALRYAGIRPALGDAFVDRVEAAASRAVRAPNTGAPMGRDLRRVFVKRFPYFVLYAVEEARVVIIAVAHFRQRPGYWRARK